MEPRKIYKVRNGQLCGVCGGIAEFLNIDPVILRILWVLFSLTGLGLLAYFICAVIMPYKDQI